MWTRAASYLVLAPLALLLGWLREASEERSDAAAGSVVGLRIGVFFGASFGGLFAAVHRWPPERAVVAAFGFFVGALCWFPFFDAAAGNLRGVVSEPVTAVVTTLLTAMWLACGMVVARLLGRSGLARA